MVESISKYEADYKFAIIIVNSKYEYRRNNEQLPSTELDLNAMKKHLEEDLLFKVEVILNKSFSFVH
jgi:hypothetical protein